MAQNRDPKTGRYTSGNGSSIGGAAGTNPRIQKAKSVGVGNSAWGSSEIKNSIPQLSDTEEYAVDSLVRGKENTVYKAPVEDVSLEGIRSMQKTLRKDSIQYLEDGGVADDYPVILQAGNLGNVVLDGNHRINKAIKEGKTHIKAHYPNANDLLLSNDDLIAKYKNK